MAAWDRLHRGQRARPESSVIMNLSAHSPAHDAYALRFHLQVVHVVDEPSLVAISQLSLLLSVIATCADMNGRNLNTRIDPSAKAIAATSNILNRMSGRKDYAPNAEESRVLRACSGVLDRLFRRFPAARLDSVEEQVRIICGAQLCANDGGRMAA